MELAKNTKEITTDIISGNFVLTSLGAACLRAKSFLDNIQQTTKRTDKNLTPYKNNLNAVDIEEEMVLNNNAKAVARQKLEKTYLKSESEQPLTSSRSETTKRSLENGSQFKVLDADEEEDEFNVAKDNLFVSPTTGGIKQWFTFK